MVNEKKRRRAKVLQKGEYNGKQYHGRNERAE
jgi:hypothetical protein